MTVLIYQLKEKEPLKELSEARKTKYNTNMSKKEVKTTNTTKMSIKKEQAIELWRETHGHISNICRALGIARSTFYEWMQDPEYSMKLVDAEQELNDDIRDVLVSKAADGDMTAVIFYLKSRHPDFKQEKTQVNQQFNVGADKGNVITFVNFKNATEN